MSRAPKPASRTKVLNMFLLMSIHSEGVRCEPAVLAATPIRAPPFPLRTSRHGPNSRCSRRRSASLGAWPPPETRLVLVRHGESVAQEQGFLSGHDTCTGLSDAGRAQVARCGTGCVATGELGTVDAVYTSILPGRSRPPRSSRPRSAGVAPQQECEWCEIHAGEAEGLTWAEFRERYPSSASSTTRSGPGPPAPRPGPSSSSAPARGCGGSRSSTRASEWSWSATAGSSARASSRSATSRCARASPLSTRRRTRR